MHHRAWQIDLSSDTDKIFREEDLTRNGRVRGVSSVIMSGEIYEGTSKIILRIKYPTSSRGMNVNV